MNEPSEDYRKALAATQTFHTKQKGFNGRFLLRYLDDVFALVRRETASSMLDYGCGRGEQYTSDVQGGLTLEETFKRLGVDRIGKFDPGFPPFAKDPVGKFGLVICTQVLGSIPITDLPWVLDRLAAFSDGPVYIAEVLCIAPRKQLHANLRGKMPHGWMLTQWQDAIVEASRRWPGVTWYLRTKDKTVPKGARLLTTISGGEIVNTATTL